MTNRYLFTIIFVATFLVFSSTVLAAVSNLISVQGRLTNQNAQLQNGSFVMNFSLYSTETGGAVIASDQLNVNATNGIFEAYVGSNNSLAGVPFDRQYYLGITVGTDAEMTPRIRVGSSGYSFRSNITEFLNTTTVAEGRLNFSASGNITFGADTNLYRSAANTLRTDDALVVGNSITPATDNIGALGSANNRWPQLFLDTVAGVSLWNSAGDSNPLARLTGTDLNFGAGGSSAPDTILRRLRANVLTTDDNMTIAGNLTVNLGLNLTDVPVITFGTLGDTNLYRSAANRLQTDDDFYVIGHLNASSTAYIQGNVGINTLTPTDRLVVQGDPANNNDATVTILSGVSGESPIVNLTHTTGNTWIMTGPDNFGSLHFRHRFQNLYPFRDVVTFANNSNIGINTSTPQALLNLLLSAGSTVPFNITNLGTGNTVWIGDESADTTPFVIDSSGNVGIGTTNPLNKLEIVGAVNITGPNSNLTVNGSIWQPMYGSDDGLVLYLPFNEGGNGSNIAMGNSQLAISTTYDRSPYGNDGTLTNMNLTGNATSGWNTTDCKAGSCMNFDGVNDYINVPDNDNLDIFPSTSFSVCTWFKTSDTVAGSVRMLSKWDGTNAVFWEVWYGGVSNGRLSFVVDDTGDGSRDNKSSTTTVASDNNWHHFCGIRNNVTDRLLAYLDGRLEGNAADGTIQSLANSISLRVGGRGFAGTNFNGTMDEVRIYNRALSADEIRLQYLFGLQSHGTVIANKFRIVNTTGNVTFEMNNTGMYVDIVDSTFRIDTINNRVGIGTTSPQKTLDVVGVINTTQGINISAGANNQIVFGTDTNLYRSAANILKTDDNLTVAGAYVITAGNATPGSDALVGYWSFDEGFGSRSNDGSGYENQTGELFGFSMPNTDVSGWNSTHCKYGSCLYFDGANDYVNITNTTNAALNLTNQSFSYSLWMKVPNVVLPNSIYTILANSVASGEWVLSYRGEAAGAGNAGRLHLASTPNDVITDVNLTKGSWQHVALACNATTGQVIIYFNGVSVRDGTFSGCQYPPTWSGRFVIGAGAGLANYFNGSLDEVKIYKKALTPEEVRVEFVAGAGSRGTSISAKNLVAGGWVNATSLNVTNNAYLGGLVGIGTTAPNSKLDVFGQINATRITVNNSDVVTIANATAGSQGLVGYWTFDESAGSNAYDASGFSNTGTLTGMNLTGNTTSGWNITDCKYGSCLIFDGSNDYVSIPNSASLHPNNSISISVWYKLRELPQTGGGDIVIGDQDASYEILINPSGTARFSMYDVDLAQNVIGTFTISTGRWYHIVATYNNASDTGQQRLYVDGVLRDSADTAGFGGIRPSGNDIWIGRRSTLYSNSTMDEVKIYNRVLTADEVKAEFLAGSSKHEVTLSAKNIVAGSWVNATSLNVTNNAYLGGNVGIGGSNTSGNLGLHAQTGILSTGNITPGATNTYGLGNTTHRWGDIWVRNSNVGDLIFDNSFKITEEGNTTLKLLDNLGNNVVKWSNSGIEAHKPFRLVTQSSQPFACTTEKAGYMFFNTTDNTFRGCNGSSWVKLG